MAARLSVEWVHSEKKWSQNGASEESFQKTARFCKEEPFFCKKGQKRCLSMEKRLCLEKRRVKIVPQRGLLCGQKQCLWGAVLAPLFFWVLAKFKRFFITNRCQLFDKDWKDHKTNYKNMVEMVVYKLPGPTSTHGKDKNCQFPSAIAEMNFPKETHKHDKRIIIVRNENFSAVSLHIISWP